LICCCTGHRPQKFPFDYGGNGKQFLLYLQALKNKIIAAITERGVKHFISGMALGVDLDFAETVLKLRKKYCITLECAIPCPNQTLNWTEKDKARYGKIIKKADSVTLFSESYTHDCMLKRNRYMIDKSDIVIAVYNGIPSGGTWYTIKYAAKTNKSIELIKLCGF